MTLFRIVQLLKGNILIDNHDIATVPLQILRRRIAIIPQDPVLFSGSIRFQLDPFNEFTDEKIWGALSEVSMKDYVESTPHKLDEILYERGENLSQGQRQLLCIARALLRKSKIIVIDEGTSAVDPHTDNVIQEVLKANTDKNKSTILTVAHRLSTIVNYDKVLVLRDGVVVEFDTPNNLIDNKNSLFYSMLQENRD
jgi:ABC-type branched-subunit amino acid transport system ATPase component